MVTEKPFVKCYTCSIWLVRIVGRLCATAHQRDGLFLNSRRNGGTSVPIGLSFPLSQPRSGKPNISPADRLSQLGLIRHYAVVFAINTKYKE